MKPGKAVGVFPVSPGVSEEIDCQSGRSQYIVLMREVEEKRANSVLNEGAPMAAGKTDAQPAVIGVPLGKSRGFRRRE